MDGFPYMITRAPPPTQAQAAQLLSPRQELGKFLHPDDLTNCVGIDVDTYDRISDRLIAL